EAPEERDALRTDDAEIRRDALLLPLAQVIDDDAELVDVQRAAEAAVGRDDDVADPLDVALDEIWMTVIGVRLRQVTDDLADVLGVRPRRLHALLSAAQLRRRDHLHGLRDLLRVLHAVDLGADFFAACHSRSPWRWREKGVRRLLRPSVFRLPTASLEKGACRLFRSTPFLGRVCGHTVKSGSDPDFTLSMRRST